MSHETTHHHDAQVDKRPTTQFRSSFWFVLILIGLFLGAVNFANVMGHDEGHEGAGHGEATHESATHGEHEEHVGGAANAPMEATSNQTMSGESGLGKPAADSAAGHEEAGH